MTVITFVKEETVNFELVETLMMKALHFSFEHPVKGRLRFRPLSGQQDAIICRPFDAGTGTTLTVSLKGLEAGSWELAMEWEHEERVYHHQQIVEVNDSTESLFKTHQYAGACLLHSPYALHV